MDLLNKGKKMKRSLPVSKTFFVDTEKIFKNKTLPNKIKTIKTLLLSEKKAL